MEVFYMQPHVLPTLIFTIALVVLLVAALIRFFMSIPVEGWSRAFSKALGRILIAGIVAYLLPYVMLAEISDAVIGVPKTIYAVLQTISIQAPFEEAVDIVRMSLENTGAISCIANIYAFFLLVLSIATPFVVVTTAINTLKDRLQHLKFLSHRKHHRVVYAFSNLSDLHVSIARDILRNRAESSQVGIGSRHIGKDAHKASPKLRPLIVFCGITNQVLSDNSDLIESLRDDGKGDVVLSQNSIPQIVDELIEFDNIHCFAFSEDHSENMEDTADLIDTISITSALRAHALDATTEKENAERLAMKFSVYCTHESSEDELFFDSLAGQEYDLGKWTEHASQQIDEAALNKLAEQARSRIEVRLVSLTQERVYDALTNHPLYEVLDPIDTSNNSVPEQDLWVIVVGLGQNGIAALQAAYWIGRLHSVRLHILGIDSNGSAIERRLKTTHSEMMNEHDAYGDRVVEIREARTLTPEFEEILKTIPSNARIYAMVTLGDDQLNLNVALSLRRTFDDLMLDGYFKDPGIGRRPKVLPLIYAHEIFRAAECMRTDRNEPFDITPFGRNRTVFSFHNIVVAPWEQYAIAMAAAYMEMFDNNSREQSLLRGTQVKMSYGLALADYGRFEIRKLSNRTCVRHIPYRLWSLGVDPSVHFDAQGVFIERELTNERWLELLGINSQEANYLLCQPDGPRNEEITSRYLNRLRNEFPTVCRLADLEHDRWVAFYRSQGWQDLTIEECQKLVDMGIISDMSRHQSPKLRRHCYLCDIETLVSRGVALQDDPFVYDRAAIVESQRILTGSIFANE